MGIKKPFFVTVLLYFGLLVKAQNDHIVLNGIVINGTTNEVLQHVLVELLPYKKDTLTNRKGGG